MIDVENEMLMDESNCDILGMSQEEQENRNVNYGERQNAAKRETDDSVEMQIQGDKSKERGGIIKNKNEFLPTS